MKNIKWIATLATTTMLVSAASLQSSASIEESQAPARGGQKALERLETDYVSPLQGRFFKAIAASENESENDTCPGSSISCGSSLTASLATGSDLDYFWFTANEGDRIIIETSQSNPQQPFVDTVLQLMDANCFQLFREDDDGGDKLFSRIHFTAPRAGNFTIQVSGYQGAIGDYSLSLDCTPGGLYMPGDQCVDAEIISCGQFWFSGTTDTADLNDDYAIATAECGLFPPRGRDVVYRIEANAGDRILARYQSTADGVMYLVGSDCSIVDDPIACSDAVGAGEEEIIDLVLTEGGTYHLILDSHGLNSGGEYSLCGLVDGGCMMLVGLNDVDQARGVDQVIRFSDPSSGEASMVGSLGGAFVETEALASIVSSVGEFIYAIDNDRLLRINQRTGEGTEVGPLGAANIDAMAFHPRTGELWAATQTTNRIYKIDRRTGLATLVSRADLVSHPITDMAFHPWEGPLNIAYMLTDGFPQRLYKVDLDTGAKLRRWILSSNVSSMESLAWSLDGEFLYSAADRGGFKDLVKITLDQTPGSEVGSAEFVSAMPSGYRDIEALGWMQTKEVVQAFLSGWNPTTTDVGDRTPPRGVVLSGNFPNPFNPMTRIEFDLPSSRHVDLRVFDIAGRKVKTLHSGALQSGAHQFLWDGKNERGAGVAAGVYFYSLSGEGWTETKRMTLIK